MSNTEVTQTIIPKCVNLRQLIEILQQYPPETKWYGFDDGSINLKTENQEICIESDYYDPKPDVMEDL